MYKLIIQDDEGKTTVVPLIRDELTIGRQEGNTIRLTERNVSRRHAKLHRGQENILIEDLDSYNGVRVNGSRIQGKIEIKEADRVRIGDYLIEVKAEAAPVVGDDDATTQIAAIAAPVPVPVSPSDAATAPTPMPEAAPQATAAGSGNLSAEAEAVTKEESHPRLVVLSTQMAGLEFELDKPAMVIGRTDENDLCIDHRSISRHHAKVVSENGSYSVIDLQSANGVRVNGEEYGKVELRAGDLVDLGHVRLRFVAVGEDFVFGRDAQVVDISGEQSSSGKGIWIGIGLVAAAAIGFFALRGGDTKPDSSSGQNQAASQQTPSQTPTTPTTPPKEVEKKPAIAIDAAAEASGDSSALLDYIDQALAAREKDDWKAMEAAAFAALNIDGTHRKAGELAQQARFELSNKKFYDGFQAAVADKKWSQIAFLFNSIEAASVYKVKGQSDHDRMKAEYQRYQLQVGQKAAKRGRCAEVTRQADQVPGEWSSVGDALRALPCTKAVASNTSPKTPRNPKNGNDSDSSSTNKPPVEETLSAQEVNDQISQAIRSTQYETALSLCAKHSNATARFCVIAACNSKRVSAAKRFLRRVKSSGTQRDLQQICLKKGVVLD